MDDWTQHVKARGLSGTVHTLLDILEPLGVLGAQLLYVLQPASGLFGARDMLADIANALETPGGIDALRRRLEDSE